MALLLPPPVASSAPSTVTVSSAAIRDNTALLRAYCGTPVISKNRSGVPALYR